MDQRVLKAFRRADVDQILELVEQNPDDCFQGRTPQRNTALHLAARLGDKHVVDKILNLKPSFLYEKNQNGETPMHIAAKAGNVSVIKAMLEHDDNNINLCGIEHILCMRDNQGNMPLHNAIKNYHNLLSVLLINKHHETMLSENNAKQSPLSIAVEIGSTYIAWFIMKKNQFSLYYRGPNDLTLLHYAVINQNYVSVVEIVHRKEELIKEVDKDKRNPLHYAAVLGNVAIANRLLEADASFSVAYGRDCNGQTPLHLAAKYGRRDILRLILIDYSDSIEVVDERQRNILHLAALNGKDDIVKFILRLPEMEDLINSPDVDGNTPLHLAALNSHKNVFDILSRDDKVNKRATNSNQQTALAITRSSRDAKLDIKKEEKREMAQVVLLIATIIVTCTFTAALTLPGGYNDKDPHEGTARLVRKPGFKTFVISIAIAMTSAMTAAVLALGHIRNMKHGRLGDVDLMFPAIILVYFGLLTMSVAFMTGLYVVLYTNSVLAITIISISCVFPYMMIFLATVSEVGMHRFEEFLYVFLTTSFPLGAVVEPTSFILLRSLFGVVFSTANRVIPLRSPCEVVRSLLEVVESAVGRVQSALGRVLLSAAGRVLYVADRVLYAAGRVLSTAGRVLSAAGRVLSAIDRVLSAPDRVPLSALDRVPLPATVRVIPDWVLFLANKLYLLESTYIWWYDRQIKYILNSSQSMVHVDLVVALLRMLRYLVQLLWLKSNPSHHTAALEFTSTI